MQTGLDREIIKSLTRIVESLSPLSEMFRSSLTPFHYMWITKGDYTNSYPLFLSKI